MTNRIKLVLFDRTIAILICLFFLIFGFIKFYKFGFVHGRGIVLIVILVLAFIFYLGKMVVELIQIFRGKKTFLELYQRDMDKYLLRKKYLKLDALGKILILSICLFLYFIKDLKQTIFFIPFVLTLFVSDLYRYYKFKK